MLMMDLNPFIYGENSDNNVQSSVMDMRVCKCEVTTHPDGSRRKRSVPVTSTLNPVIPFTVSLVPKDLPEPEVVDKPKAAGLVYHQIEISDPARPIQINIYPRDMELLNVYGDINQKPTVTNYTWNFTIPHLQYIQEENKTFDENSTIPQAAYTITFSALQLEMALNGTLDLFQGSKSVWEYAVDLDEETNGTNTTEMTTEGPTTVEPTTTVEPVTTIGPSTLGDVTTSSLWDNSTTSDYNWTEPVTPNRTLFIGVSFRSMSHTHAHTHN